MSLRINHPTGTRTVDPYRVLSDPHENELTGETNRAGKLVTRGDRGRRPAPLEILMDLQETTLAASVALADTILAEARTATSVETHHGIRLVSGILEHALAARGPAVRLTLYFNPASKGDDP